MGRRIKQQFRLYFLFNEGSIFPPLSLLWKWKQIACLNIYDFRLFIYFIYLFLPKISFTNFFYIEPICALLKIRRWGIVSGEELMQTLQIGFGYLYIWRMAHSHWTCLFLKINFSQFIKLYLKLRREKWQFLCQIVSHFIWKWFKCLEYDSLSYVFIQDCLTVHKISPRVLNEFRYFVEG